MRKLMTLISVSALALVGLQSMPAQAADCVSSGDGSQGSPHVICNATDFTALQTATSGNYILGADIDLSGTPWNDNTYFNGTLNGAGHVVNGLTIVSSAATQVSGLFDDLQEDSLIENIKFTNTSLTVDGRGYSGILAYGIYGIVSQVEIQGTVTSNSGYTGGFAGQLNGGRIVNSVSNLEITNTGNGYIGGFVGTASGTPTIPLGSISNSLFTGSMTGGMPYQISMDAMPYWDPMNDPGGPPMPSCDFVIGTFYLASEPNNRSCGSNIAGFDLRNATPTTMGFENWNTNVWAFAPGEVYPQLKQFIKVPVEKLFPTAIASSSSIDLSWLPPVGDFVTTVDVQVRTYYTTWTTAQVSGTDHGVMINGLTNGENYWVRIRATNPGAKGEWNYVMGAVTPIGVASTVPVLSLKTAKSKVTIKWTAPSSTNGSAVKNYSVGVFKTATSATPFKIIKVGTKLLATLSGVKAGTNVWIAIRAENGAGLNLYGTKTKIKIKK